MSGKVGYSSFSCQAQVGDFPVGSAYQFVMDTLGSRIRHARKAKGLKQADIAQHFGIARTNLSAWENDDHGPELAKLEPLARLLGVEVGWLMSGDGPGPVDLDYKRPASNPEAPASSIPAILPRVAAIPGSETSFTDR